MLCDINGRSEESYACSDRPFSYRTVSNYPGRSANIEVKSNIFVGVTRCFTRYEKNASQSGVCSFLKRHRLIRQVQSEHLVGCTDAGIMIEGPPTTIHCTINKVKSSISHLESVPSLLSMADKSEIAVSEVAQHNKSDDCWMVVNGKVYDLTSFAPKHPGGAQCERITYVLLRCTSSQTH